MSHFLHPLQIISLDEDGFHLITEINVYGQDMFAVVDTGASRSVFDKDLILRHADNTVHVPSTQANTLFSVAESFQSILPVLKIGRLKIKEYQAVAIDLSSVVTTYKELGHPAISAIIGGDILMKYAAKIDYSRKTIRFTIHK